MLQGTRRIAFVVPPTISAHWEGEIRNLANSSIDRVQCAIEISNNPGDERIQCSAIEYQDYWSPNSWYQCRKSLPLEFSIKVV